MLLKSFWERGLQAYIPRTVMRRIEQGGWPDPQSKDLSFGGSIPALHW